MERGDKGFSNLRHEHRKSSEEEKHKPKYAPDDGGKKEGRGVEIRSDGVRFVHEPSVLYRSLKWTVTSTALVELSALTATLLSNTLVNLFYALDVLTTLKALNTESILNYIVDVCTRWLY